MVMDGGPCPTQPCSREGYHQVTRAQIHPGAQNKEPWHGELKVHPYSG